MSRSLLRTLACLWASLCLLSAATPAQAQEAQEAHEAHEMHETQEVAPAAQATPVQPRCARDGFCLTHVEPGILYGACRMGAQEMRFDIFSTVAVPKALRVETLQWADWCARIVDPDSHVLTAVYGSQACLDRWLPGWNTPSAAADVAESKASSLFAEALTFDCLGMMMDVSKDQPREPAWMILRALAHSALMSCQILR